MSPPGSEASSATLVLCPMAIERAAVVRALWAAGLDAVRILQTGIGKDAILRTLERELAPGSPLAPDLVILAGACGGLRPTPDVPRIARIIDTHGRVWISPLADPAGLTLLAVDRIIDTPAAKRKLADETGAAVVDMESHAFAAACERLGVPWAVVRGVSDTPDEMLPAEVLQWIDPEGNTRPVRAAFDLLTRPRLIPPILSVVRRSKRVLPQVGREVARLATTPRGFPLAQGATPP